MLNRKRKTIKKLAGFGTRALFAALVDKIRYMRIMRAIPDTWFVKFIYRVHFGHKLNLINPESFNEKLQWLKLYYRNDCMPNLVDKITVKDYISQVVGDNYVVPTIGVWDSLVNFDIDTLPSSFVLKCSHDSGSVIICKDKRELDLESIIRKMSKHLKMNLFYWGREWPYKYIKPRLLAEPLLTDSKVGELYDYKFFCFNGKARCFKIDFGRFTEHHANYYDLSGGLLPISEIYCPAAPDANIQMPSSIKEMVCLAEKLANGFPFLRVDFYNTDDHIYIGELTFFPASGLSPFVEYDSDLLLGSWLDIPKYNVK